MLTNTIDSIVGFVTTHNRLTILIILLLTAGIIVGVTQDTGAGTEGVDDDELGQTEVWEAANYIDEAYGQADDEAPEHNQLDVYVYDADGDVLTRAVLLELFAYEAAVMEHEEATADLVEPGIIGPHTLIAQELAEISDPSHEEQVTAIEQASDEKLTEAVVSVFDGGAETRQFLPIDYDPASASSEGMRLAVVVDADADVSFNAGDDMAPIVDVLYEEAGAHDDPAIFTTGPHAIAELNNAFITEALWLILPPILVIMLLVLTFAYRDFTDVVIGFTGTLVALLWTFGLMGWLGVLSQQTALIAPVLIVAISIDFGFHIFMRYREQRGLQEGIRSALRRSTGAVAIAFLLVTITAAVGFLSNLTSPMPVIRDVGIAITFGVLGAFVIFTTLVPALKVSADGLWERFGFERRKTPLGKGDYLSQLLLLGIRPARYGAIAVIVVAVVVGGAGGLAFAELDREAFQQANTGEVADWKTELPGPMAFEFMEEPMVQEFLYAQSHFQPDEQGVTEGGQGMTQLLVEPDDGVATEEALALAHESESVAADADSEFVIQQGGNVDVISPLSVMQDVAEADTDFAETFEAADTTSDGVPDENVEGVYDALFATAPDEAAQVIERTDDGDYATMLIWIPAHAEFGTNRANTMNQIADDLEAASTDTSVTAVGIGTIQHAETERIAEGIVDTMLIALGSILVLLAVVYRVVRGRAVLGILTVLPIALAMGIVFGGMYVLNEPLTPLTALLVSITIGLGIDYNIHLSDRFAHELQQGKDLDTALREAVTGTGGALLGSAMTSGSAFLLLMIVPDPQFTSFGLIVALALFTSFLLSVFVLPSLLRLWGESTGPTNAPG